MFKDKLVKYREVLPNCNSVLEKKVKEDPHKPQTLFAIACEGNSTLKHVHIVKQELLVTQYQKKGGDENKLQVIDLINHVECYFSHLHVHIQK